MVNTRKIGRIGESVAAKFLARKGYLILEKNYLRSVGEVDIVAEKGNTVRFVEVKSVSRENGAQKQTSDFSRETGNYRPEEQVHPKKLQKIAKTAEVYMVEHEDDREYQIDVVGVFLDQKARTARCRLYENVS